MAANPGQPHYGPYQPVALPPQQPPYQSTTVGSQSCYNCGSHLHMAQFCSEPRRQVPAGSLAQKPRLTKNNNIKKMNKPVITRYAPPPGYMAPQPGVAIPPPPPPPPVAPAPYVQQGPYPQHAAQPYAHPTTPTTPQWQPSPQNYPAQTHQWQQQQQPPAPNYGPHPPQPQPAYNAYGQPVSPYPAQHSPAQAYPPQPSYTTAHLQPPQPQYPQYNQQQQQQQQQHHHQPPPPPPQPPAQVPQAPYIQPQLQQLQVPAYPQSAQYQVQSPSFGSRPQQGQAGWQPYRPPPKVNNQQQFQQGAGPGPAPYSQRPGPVRDYQNPRQNSHNSHGHYGGRGGRGGGGTGRDAGRDGRQKQFQAPPPQADNALPRPPSPPRFFPQPTTATVKSKSGALIWKSPQPVDSPIEAIYDATTEHPNSITTNPGANKGKNVIGSKYFDSEGNRIKIENIVKKPAKKEGAEEKPNDMEDVEADSTAKEDTQEESKADEIEDPVWHSVRTGGSTRADMEGYNYVPDQETEDLIKQLKRAQGGEAPTNGNAASNGDAMDTSSSGSRKQDGKKRSWDEFLVTNKPGQEQQERRPNKRRHGNNNNEGRGRRNNNRNFRHGNNKAPGNRPSTGQSDTIMTGTHINTEPPSAPQPLVHRSFHPLPPKPSAGPPPPPPSSYVNSISPTPPRSQSNNRRSASPTRQQEKHHRQRDSDIGNKNDTACQNREAPNPNVRRRGSPDSEVYSRRW